jgi:hypothetical protein
MSDFRALDFSKKNTNLTKYFLILEEMLRCMESLKGRSQILQGRTGEAGDLKLVTLSKSLKLVSPEKEDLLTGLWFDPPSNCSWWSLFS